MNECAESGREMQISLSEMKLLVTAVISFDPGQIVSAFLAVQQLKESLIKELDDCKASNESSSQENTQRVSLLDQMQSVFLRSDTSIEHPDSAPETNSTHLNELSSHVETSTTVDVTTTSTATVEFAVSDTSIESFTNIHSTQPLNDNDGVAKKGSRLDQLLRDQLTHSSFKSVNKQRHALCTKQVSDVVERSSPRMLKPRKRKNTLPRYNPYQSLSSGKRLADCFRKPVSSTIAKLLDVSSPSDQTLPANFTCTTTTSNTDTQQAGEEVISTSKESTTPSSTILTETLSANVEMMADQGKVLPPSGPFVTNGTEVLPPLHATTPDVDFTLPSSLTDNFVGVSGDLPGFALGDQGFATGISEMVLFDDIPSAQLQLCAGQEVSKAPGVKPPQTHKRRLKGSSQELDDDRNLGTSLNLPQVSEELSSSSCKSEAAMLRMKCRRCGERFTSKTEYQQHLKSQVCSTGYTHTYSCQVCGYCALTRQRLIVHMRTHSGERPHRCPFCSYAATQQAPLKRHMQNIHLKAGAISLTNPKQPTTAPLN